MQKFKDIIENLSNVSGGTWVRLILMVGSLVNLTLGAFGVAGISFDENQLYAIVSVVLAIVTGVVSYWKNNSFTAAAQAADEFLHAQGSAKEQSEVKPDEDANENEEG